MSTAQEARALADALRAEYLDGVLSAETLPRAAAMLEAQAAEIERLRAEVQSWRDTLSAVMPADLKDWHENDPAEWPQVAADLIETLRTSDALAWEGVEVMARDLERVTAERDAEAARAEMHADLCARTARALGLERFEGRSDMPERVAALVAERDALRAELQARGPRWADGGDAMAGALAGM